MSTPIMAGDQVRIRESSRRTPLTSIKLGWLVGTVGTVDVVFQSRAVLGPVYLVSFENGSQYVFYADELETLVNLEDTEPIYTAPDDLIESYKIPGTSEKRF